MTRWILAAALLIALPIAAAAQQPSGTQADTDALDAASTKKHATEVDTQAEVRHALFRLPAAALGRRSPRLARGTPRGGRR